MIVPSLRLLYIFAVVVLPGAALLGIPGWSGAGYLMVALVVLLAGADAGISFRRLHSISIESPVQARMWRGQASTLELTIRNDGSPRRVRIGLAAPPEIGMKSDELSESAPAGVSRLTWPCVPTRRGRYSILRYAVETSSVLGLWALRATRPLQLEVRVYPDLSSVQRTSPAYLRRGETGLYPQRQIGRGREFEKLRDYSPGDGFDEVDWKATARRGRPITRVFQLEKTQEVYVIVDASRLTARPASAGSPDSILERNVTAALLLALAAEKQGDLFGLVTFSDRVHSFVRARNGKAHYGACREALYTLHARSVTPDFDEVCSLLRLRLRRRALLIFLTELDDPVLAASFIRNALLIRRRHLVLVGMMQPDGAAPLFAGPPAEDSAGVYRHLAGHLQWSSLRTVAKTLQRQGVQFALLQPDTVAAQLASAYVNLKRRQLL